MNDAGANHRGSAAVRAAASSLFALLAGCALPPWMHRPPDFPATERSWDVPLYEPLTSLGPEVVATVSGRAPAGRAPPREEVLLYVDSGSSHSALTARTFARLGVETDTSHFATIEDAGGVKRSWSGALVPEVRLGEHLALANVVASVDDRTPILGADVLGARGWQIDLDAGTLRLGADPWPAGGDVAVVPTHPFHMHTLVDLRIEGQVVPVLLDTGAPFTIVGGPVLRGLGLHEHALASRWPLGTDRRGARVDSAFEGHLALGELALGERRILSLPVPTSVARGMLGNDVLFGYAFQVTSGGLRLKRRPPSLFESAGTRLARWRDLPACDGVPGCIVADLVGVAGDQVPRIRVRLSAVPPRPFRYLFGCLDAQGQLRKTPLWLEIGLLHPAPNVDVEIPVQPEAPLAWRRWWAAGCGRLVLLDANPVVDGVRPLAADAESRIVLDTRHMSFN